MFLLSQNDENQSENGSKNSKIRLRARPPAEPQKKMLQTKKLRSKSWKTRVFFTFRLPILDGRVHEQVSSVLFFTVFFEGERHDLSKTGGFGRDPPPGKPVTFYECHPEDHAPAPSVRADFYCCTVAHFFNLFFMCRDSGMSKIASNVVRTWAATAAVCRWDAAQFMKSLSIVYPFIQTLAMIYSMGIRYDIIWYNHIYI